MGKRGYIVAFLVVLLLAGIGGFIGGRLLLQRLQRDFGLNPEAEWTPVATGVAVSSPAPGQTGEAVLPGIDTPAPAQDATPTRAPTATLLVVDAPGVTPLPAAENTPGGDSFVPLPTLAISETVTVEPTEMPSVAFPFALARSVRYSSGDCPGTYALGQVTDRGGNPLPNVRLSLVDEFGNAQSAVTKSGQGDAGRYDFPMFGDPRRFYMMVVDEAGRALSDRVEIVHNMPPHENQPCRWVDWRRRQ